MAVDGDSLRKQYLDALTQEIASGRARLSAAREHVGPDPPRRAGIAAAVAGVTLEWLEREHDRVRAGGPFDEETARRVLAARRNNA